MNCRQFILVPLEIPAYKLPLSNKDMKKVEVFDRLKLMVGKSGADIVLSGRFLVQ